MLHVGTVIEGPTEYRSSRILNKDRRGSIVEEILSDKKLANYSKNTYMKIQAEKSNKRKVYKSKHEPKQRKIRKLY